MPTAPSAFPLLGAPQALGDQPNPPEGGNSLGGRPPEAVEKIQQLRRTQPDPRRSQYGRPKCNPTTESAKMLNMVLQSNMLATTPRGILHIYIKIYINQMKDD